jgi:dual specificity tyrosine-phosphorylation-regulated kinase 2/3/4
MFTGVPLFSADDETELINLIVEMRGLPPLSLLKSAPRAHHYFDMAGHLKPKGNGKTRPIVPGSKSIREATKLNDPVFLSLIDQCLTWEASTRITAEQFLQHPWLAAREPGVEVVPQSAR